MTDAQLAEIAARAEAATPGPWAWDSYNTVFDSKARVMAEISDHPNGDLFAPSDIAERGAWYNESASNAAFIAAARTYVPLLLEEVRRLRAELRAADMGIENCNNVIGNQQDEIERLRGIVAAVEALPEKWRTDEMAERCSCYAECADELSAALGGKSNE